MYEGDRSRKTTLVDYGFRLPSAMDNRPQTFDEFLKITPQMLFVSATPGDFERDHSSKIVEQIVRPTGIVDPEVDVRETRNQIDDLMNEVRKVVDSDERVLVTTLTKKMSEDLTDYLLEMGFKVRYLHSEIDTLERIQIIRDLRLGEYDVLVGVNLLREGLDLPEVSLVAILDADKEGFLRGETSLIQTIGRAARNVEGRVLMYADKETAAMRAALAETDRRRAIQVAYNEEHGITPESIVKGISDIAEFLHERVEGPQEGPRTRTHAKRKKGEEMTLNELEKTIVELEEEMVAAAEDLRFEYAARLRDEIRDLRRELRELREDGAPGVSGDRRPVRPQGRRARADAFGTPVRASPTASPGRRRGRARAAPRGRARPDWDRRGRGAGADGASDRPAVAAAAAASCRRPTRRPSATPGGPSSSGTSSRPRRGRRAGGQAAECGTRVGAAVLDFLVRLAIIAVFVGARRGDRGRQRVTRPSAFGCHRLAHRDARLRADHDGPHGRPDRRPPRGRHAHRHATTASACHGGRGVRARGPRQGLLFEGIGGLAFCIPTLLNYLWPLWDDTNEALHDKMCDTRVVEV